MLPGNEMKTTTSIELEPTDLLVVNQLLNSATLPWCDTSDRDDFLVNAKAEVYALVTDLVNQAYKMGIRDAST